MINGSAYPKTYLDVYNETIAPKLKELDIFLKERELPLTMWQISQALNMPYGEVKRLTDLFGLESLDYDKIFLFIRHGKSKLCRLLQREAETGFPTYYTASDISFIYEQDIKKVERAFAALGIIEATNADLVSVFEILPG